MVSQLAPCNNMLRFESTLVFFHSKRRTKRLSRSQFYAHEPVHNRSLPFLHSSPARWQQLKHAEVVGRRVRNVREEARELDSLDTPRAAVGQ